MSVRPEPCQVDNMMQVGTRRIYTEGTVQQLLPASSPQKGQTRGVCSYVYVVVVLIRLSSPSPLRPRS